MIVLVGFMGAGKTTVARMLAARLGLPYFDTDAVIEREAGRSVSDIFASEGEQRFRELERAVVQRALTGPEAVVSAGGGAVLETSTQELLRAHETVWLDVDPAEAAKRAAADDGSRPLLDAVDPAALHDARRPVYESVARIRVDTTGRRPQEVVAAIETRLGRGWAAGIRRFNVATGAPGYPVTIGTGLLSNFVAHVPIAPSAEKCFMITHPSLATLVQPVCAALISAGLAVEVFEIPEGETSKSLEQASGLYDRFAQAGAHRRDLVVSFGGGVIGDIAGFVASTFMRGLPLVHVPTTLLAQVDAAIGGKTAVNLAAGKNLVGTIHQPIAVVCDVDLLESCPEEEIRSGMAEVVKYGLIADPSLLDLIVSASDRLIGKDRDLLVEMIARSVAVKASIVATDEREMGDRAFLNYGHTFGHAIEAVRGFGAIRHGEAVALGMMAAAYTAAELGRLDERDVEAHREALAAVGLPVSGRFDHDQLSPAWTHDKKFDRGARFVLLRGLGQPEAGVLVEPEVLRTALTRLARED